MAASRSMFSATSVGGRSVGLIDTLQIGSLVPFTIRRLSTSSAVRLLASAVTSVDCRVAASACADTMSSGASVPISTFTLLSSTSFCASASEVFAASTAWIV